MDSLRRMGWPQRLLLVALVLGLLLSVAVVVVFAARAMQQMHVRQSDEPIRPWMTIPYVARSYHVPARILYAAIGLPENSRDRRPLIALARAQNRGVNVLIAELHTAIVHSRPPYPTPVPDPTQVKP